MSGIGGIYNFNEAPIDMQMLNGLAIGLNNRGSDGGREVHNNSVGVIYRAFHTNKESRMEKQPLVTRYGHILAWDGRVDNREELLKEFPDGLEGDKTDVALVMAAYLEWGGEFLKYIIGDFALSLWDPRIQQIILARDPFGVRLLYYTIKSERMVWSTSISSIINVLNSRLEINEEYIAEYLVSCPPPEITPYKKFFSVPPGFIVTINRNSINKHPFYSPNINKSIRYKRDSDYEEHFRELFGEAVKCRLRSDQPVWAELSGGLDSSSIVCMAADIISKGQAESRLLNTVSYILDYELTNEESQYIKSVEHVTGIKGNHISEKDYPYIPNKSRIPDFHIPSHVLNMSNYYYAVNQLLSNCNGRVLLSGEGGDEVLTSTMDPAPYLSTLLMHGQVIKLHKNLSLWSKHLNKSYLQLLWEKAVLYKYQSNKRTSISIFNAYNKIIRNEFVNKQNLDQRAVWIRGNFGTKNLIKRDLLQNYFALVRTIAAGYWQELYNADITYPFTHLPLVEFLQAIPFDQRVRPNETRSILRRSLRKILPTEFINQKSKIENCNTLIKSVSRERDFVKSVFSNARCCAYGYIDQPALHQHIQAAINQAPSSCVHITNLIPLELWIRKLDAHNELVLEQNSYKYDERIA